MQKHDCKEELRAAGSRATPGRLALLAALEKSRRPLSVAQLQPSVRSNTVTLYRTLRALAAAGLVRQGNKGRVAYYEYAGRPHHHHMTCTECGFNQLCRAC